MRYRPIGTDPADPRLGRFVPDDWQHLERYPLTALATKERPVRTPVVIGVNWYREFDDPEPDGKSGEMFIAKGGSVTTVRGGHCVCLEPGGTPDTDQSYNFYNQGAEGACVGFGWSRCMTLFNGDDYAARWLWDAAKKRDEWAETNPGDENGTSVRAAAEVLRELGHVEWQDEYSDDDWRRRESYTPDVKQGIRAFRWARTVDEVHAALGNHRADELGAVPLLNSWGANYPHRVWLPDEVLDRLIREEGEIAVPTDR
ncbi:hypothetical protein [Amycolatopsis sp. FDAARGOS 1241]|uniref:hypothetical protein n=1 Tax=Amycolatopsis sp. FDAARGOS 1241 TaxID=2778070 RepID=UPI0019502E1D|nr:hypothetical protein [Amycolatopsis sp. FDAARGOS 1241]QRP47479.1 hypothetical protein I6J71_05835 [Amycolatopsis sp. FDAARGOS 1241]